MNLYKNILLIVVVTVSLILTNGCNRINEQSTLQQNNAQGLITQANSFLFPESSIKKLTQDQLRGLDDKKLALARNEIFARRGYIFNETEYKNYFSQKEWYKPDPNFNQGDLNLIERYNVNFIKFFEDKLVNDANLYGERKQLSNVYQLGQAVTLDINGDGSSEKILCQKEGGKVKVTINDSSLVIESDNPSQFYAIVDIDNKDKYQEIALSDFGPSNDLTSVFCYYDGKNVIAMGKTQGLYNIENKLDGSILIDGSGKIIAKTRSKILQTWFYDKEFLLNSNHRLQEIPVNLYPTDYDVYVIQPIKLYADTKDKDPTLSIKDGQTLKIIGTDNQVWCLVQTTTGVKGWIAVDHYDTLRNNGLKAEDTFAGLSYAD